MITSYPNVMASDLEDIYDRLFEYCRERDFAGHDPFDGLSSRFFQMTPLRHSRTARLVWLQAVKRSPVDVRRLLGVPAGVNPKTLALFALAELSRFRATRNERHAENARDLIGGLLANGIEATTKNGTATRAFGYNFDWQSRHFLAPRGTPAIVPTAFAAHALIEAYEEFHEETLRDHLVAMCEFIRNDLKRSVETDDEVCFSYTPLDTTRVYNASLLAGECLARTGRMTDNEEYVTLAEKAARFVVRHQRPDGSWGYGEADDQGWVDNFHTAYILTSLHRIIDVIPSARDEFVGSVTRGLNYWLDTFFREDGAPKYYNDGVYPIDIHSAAVAIATLCELRSRDPRALALARKTAAWTIANMRDTYGFFYYQLRKRLIISTPFMRWGQAWMAYTLARLIEAEQDGH